MMHAPIHGKLAVIAYVVAQRHDVEADDLLGPSREARFVRPRQAAFQLAREFTDHSYPEIGRYFGDRDHTTVIHGEMMSLQRGFVSGELRADVEHRLRAAFPAFMSRRGEAYTFPLSFPNLRARAAA